MNLVKGEEVVGIVSKLTWDCREVEAVLGLPEGCAIWGRYVPAIDSVVVIRDFNKEARRKIIRGMLGIPQKHTNKEITQAFKLIATLPKENL